MALLTTMSIPPKRSTACSTAAFDLRLVAHVAEDRQRLCRRPPRSPRRRCGSCPGSFGCGWSVLAMNATFAPSRASRFAIARPIPRLPPDMNTVLPLRSPMAGEPKGQTAAGPTSTPATSERAWKTVPPLAGSTGLSAVVM